MEIKLLDFEGNGIFTEIPDDTDKIVIKVFSGDMVMTYPYYMDSSYCRELNFYDGEYIIPRKNFQKLNQMSGRWTLEMLEQLKK